MPKYPHPVESIKLHCSQNRSHGLETQTELLWAPGVNPKWQENFTFTGLLFSRSFCFPDCFVFVSDSWPSRTGVLV